jgi:predicted SprT family Zn-dependent metalloprotease
MSSWTADSFSNWTGCLVRYDYGNMVKIMLDIPPVLWDNPVMNIHDALDLGKNLLAKHNLSPEWSIEYDRAKTRFGQCSHVDKTITISFPMVKLNDVEHVREVILHEIAHALCDPSVGHGPRWKLIAKRIGSNASTTYDPKVVNNPRPKWRGECGYCGQVYLRHRRRGTLCGKCRSTIRWVPNSTKPSSPW